MIVYPIIFNLIYILLLIILIIFLMFYINKNIIYEKYNSNYDNNYDNNNKNKWIILLTTAVNNDEERKKLYINSINKWLKNTSFDIFVVESSDYNFDEIKNDRLHVFTFKFNEKLSSSSQYEAKSILNILNNIQNNEKYNNIYNESSHILKVTGRYYLDNIDEVLNNLENNKDLYLQIHRKNDDKWQNSEYFGIRKELLEELANTIKDEGLFEKKLYDFSLDKDYIQFGPFKNDVRRGGDNLLLSDL
jgi:hypothetical protein